VPQQVAVGIPGGSQIGGHAISVGMSANPSCVTLQVDWQNAYNTLRKNNMLVAKEQRCPALQPMVAWAYRRHSHLLVHQSRGTVASNYCAY
jgi:tRNA(Ile2) C34 agmatinyltransferase TiaS